MPLKAQKYILYCNKVCTDQKRKVNLYFFSTNAEHFFFPNLEKIIKTKVVMKKMNFYFFNNTFLQTHKTYYVFSFSKQSKKNI